MAGPLTGLRVLSTEQYRLGPTCTLLLADAGAEVVKIEPPDGGDPGRSMVLVDREGRKMPLLHSSLNRNKKSVTLDLKTAQGKEIFRRLAAVSDVLCDNMRPDTLQRLGVGYEALRALNPGLIYVTLTGFGHTDIYQSPYADWPAFDSVGQAMSGFMYSVGSEADPPMTSFIAPADTIPGLLAAYGVMLALRMRESTGQGQHVDMSMYDCMVMVTSPMVTFAAHMNQRYPRGQSPASAPYGAYKVKDGYVALHAAGEPA